IALLEKLFADRSRIAGQTIVDAVATGAFELRKMLAERREEHAVLTPAAMPAACHAHRDRVPQAIRAGIDVPRVGPGDPLAEAFAIVVEQIVPGRAAYLAQRIAPVRAGRLDRRNRRGDMIRIEPVVLIQVEDVVGVDEVREG